MYVPMCSLSWIISSYRQLCHCGCIEQPQWHGVRRWRSRASFACGTRSDMGSATALFPRPFDLEMHGLKRDTPADRAARPTPLPRNAARHCWSAAPCLVLPVESCPVVLPTSVKTGCAGCGGQRSAPCARGALPPYSSQNDRQSVLGCHTLLPSSHAIRLMFPHLCPFRIAWQHLRHSSRTSILALLAHTCAPCVAHALCYTTHLHCRYGLNPHGGVPGTAYPTSVFWSGIPSSHCTAGMPCRCTLPDGRQPSK
jgi:hypothetical protein